MRIRHIKGAEEMLKAEPLVISEPEQFRGCWREKVFGNDRPLYLEIGTGMGTFIRENALAHPEVNWIGLELNSTVLLKAVTRYQKKRAEALERLRQQGTETGTQAESGTAAEQVAGRFQPDGNLRFLWSDARLLCELFAEGEVSRIYLNFSDPWPKPKNANKRLTSPVFLSKYRQVLTPGAQIEFKTDNRDLFEYSVETAEREGWSILARTCDLHQDPELSRGNIMTEYEAKFSAKGNRICKMIIK